MRNLYIGTYTMIHIVIVCVYLTCLYVTPSLAQIYRWTDEAGKVHYTDNPETIPPHRRSQSRELSPAPGSSRGTGPATRVAPPTTTPSTSAGPSPGSLSGKVPRLRQRERALTGEIAVALQERRQYLDQLKAVRQVRMNPAFGRRRRRVDAWGRSLVAVEHQLDALRTELQQVQARLRDLVRAEPPTSSGQPPSPHVGLDARGHGRAYWRRRLEPVRARLHQAREQRQDILAHLAPGEQEERGTFGRRGQGVLRLARELEHVDQDLHDAEAAMQALQREAGRLGAPAEWLQ